jgi:hypothetical protein
MVADGRVRKSVFWPGPALVIGVAAILALLACTDASAHEGPHGIPGEQADGQALTYQMLHRELDTIAATVRPMLPMAVNEDTQATNVEVSGKELVYRYRFMVDGSAYNRDAFAQLRRSSIQSMCATPDVRTLLERGAKFTYVFFDPQEAYVTSYTICRLSCRELH